MIFLFFSIPTVSGLVVAVAGDKISQSDPDVKKG
jgi:hypothetical protein